MSYKRLEKTKFCNLQRPKSSKTASQIKKKKFFYIPKYQSITEAAPNMGLNDANKPYTLNKSWPLLDYFNFTFSHLNPITDFQWQ